MELERKTFNEIVKRERREGMSEGGSGKEKVERNRGKEESRRNRLKVERRCEREWVGRR